MRRFTINYDAIAAEQFVEEELWRNRVSDRARHYWLEAGSPSERDTEFWLRAEKDLYEEHRKKWEELGEIAKNYNKPEEKPIEQIKNTGFFASIPFAPYLIVAVLLFLVAAIFQWLTKVLGEL